MEPDSANVRELWLGEPGSGEAIGRVMDNPALIENVDDPFRNLVLLDGCFHIFGAALKMTEDREYQGVFVPASIQSITLHRELPAQVWSQVSINTGNDGRAALVDIHVLNDQGELLVEVKNLELRNTLNLSTTKQSNTATGSTVKASTSLTSKSRAQLIEFMRPLSRQERIAELAKWLTIEIKRYDGPGSRGLNLDTLPPSTIFLEIGLDSLLVTELQRRIQEKLEFRFKPMQGLNYQSIETLAGFIHDEVLSADLETVVPAASS